MAYTTIKNPSDYFNTKLYTANNTGGTSITGVGFQPDLIWFKNRTTAYGNRLCDSIRGANKLLSSNETGAEATPTDSVRSFDSDGFTLGVDNEGYGVNYPNGNNIASWNWLANGTGVSNTDGSITSTVSANTTSGFSIVKWVGTGANATVGHGLGVAPKVIIVKDLSATNNWTCYFSALGNFARIWLNLDSASQGTSGAPENNWQQTDPTSTVFSLAGNGETNGSSKNLIAYCFADVQGYSKFSSYKGNNQIGNSAPFIYTGFTPAWLMVKKSSATNHWIIWDNKRSTKNGFNIIDRKLYANLSNIENGADDVSFLSNGFKLNTNTGDWNELQDYIFMAFAENPLVGSNGIPATAR